MSDDRDFVADFERAYQRLMAMAKTDPELGALVPREEVVAAIQEPGITYRDVIARVLDGYADRPAFGVRAYEIRADAKGRKGRHYLPAYTTITYSELAAQVEAVASAWAHHPRHRVAPGEFVAYISFSGAEMAAIDFACVYAQAIGVPIQANLPAPDLMGIFRDTDPAALVASVDNLELAVGYALQQESIRSLIVIDADLADDDDREQVDAARTQLEQAGGRIALATFAEIVDYGKQFRWEPLPRHERGTDAMSLLMYTSGSTGTPKGAIVHEAMNMQFWCQLPRHQPTITVAYAPMNHFMGRNMIAMALAQGGTAYFSLKSDLSTLLEDIRIARPTYLMLIPRFCELIFQHYQSEVQRRIAGGADPQEADRAVRAEMSKTYLGDRMVAGGTGSSPTAPEVRQFIRECFDIAFMEGYGSTEAGGGGTTFGDRVMRNNILEYKLLDVPELGYYTTDKPYPRGELLLKTRLMIQGYWKRPEATAAIYDADGWLHTGDIMEERGPDHIVWCDRRNNVIKLSQAEFVAIGPLEAAYLGNSALIEQIFVYGSSYRSFLLAVVVPDMDVARSRLGHEPSQEELRTMVLAEFQETARKVGLKSFEVPRDVLIEKEPFTLENGLLSSVRKPLRPNLKRRYGDQLEAMYQEMDRKQQEELALLRAEGSGLSTLDRIAGALKANLGLASFDPESPQSYRDLGGDSLGAVALSVLFEEMFGITVPVSIVLNPAGSAKRLAQYVDRVRSAGDQGGLPTFASVHGENATMVRADDLRLEAFFDAATMDAAAEALPPAETTRIVLMTGATGFLGRFLCLGWMEKLAPLGGKVVCLIRATDAAAARARIHETFGTLDADLTERFRTLAADHLEVIAADLASPMLGLDDSEFARLASEVDHIVHPGALVNHRLSYQNLFEPNVVGTAELIRLALTERQKRFDYVSTVGVPYMNPGLTRQSEDADVREHAAEIPLSDFYASGYGASKWAGEVLLRDAHEQFGLPVTVFRPNMILAHSRYRGQINVPDMFTRLLFSVVHAGIAPRSFYELEADGSVPRAHYDGLPVDFLAAAMQQISQKPHDGFRTYNTINMHHDDGVSLDTVVDWVISAGYPVQRVQDHADWVQRFADKLRNLPDDQRQHSSLNILGHLSAPHAAHPQTVRSDKFAGTVRELGIAAEVPHITEAFIHKYLGDMRSLGLLPEPQARENAEQARVEDAVPAA